MAKTSQGEVQGVLIATPVQINRSYYLEDMWLADHHARGMGELLTLEAMRILREKGAERVSLGLIPLVDLSFDTNRIEVESMRPRIFSLGVSVLVKLMKTFYNADGLVLFRKRFNVEEWAPSYLSVKSDKNFYFLRTFQWIQVLIALALAHEPRLYFKRDNRPL